MIKRVFFMIAVFCLLSSAGKAQEYMNILAQNACDCLLALPENLDKQTFNMKLGMCMLEKAEPYSKELKRDHGIDFKNIDVDGEKLGRIIGVKMVGFCPDAVLKMSKRHEEGDGEGNVLTANGQIVKIEDDQFVVLHLREKNGKTGKYYWITFVESSMSIEEYKQLQGQAVAIFYTVEEFFDPKNKEYRYYNLISKIEAD